MRGKWVLTAKGQVGVVVGDNEHAIAVLFKRAARRFDLWLIEWHKLIGASFFETEEAAIAAKKKD